MNKKKERCELIEGGWIGDEKEQHFSIIFYDIHKNCKHFFSFKGIGKYSKHNEKELHNLTELINKVLAENEQLKNERDIENGMRNL